MKAHIQDYEDDRIARCRDKIIAALNDAHIPLTVSALILENIQMQIKIQLKDVLKPQKPPQKPADKSAEKPAEKEPDVSAAPADEAS